ncbi:MAG: hypothetical protein AAGF12_15475 [Myxococcota bacterium]
MSKLLIAFAFRFPALIFPALFLSAASCAYSTGTPENEPFLSGKLGGASFSSTDEAVVFGQQQVGEFGEGGTIYAFDFELTDVSNVTIETSDPHGVGIDTVITLIKADEEGLARGEDPEFSGERVASDDNGGEDYLAALSAEIDAGWYRLLVKATPGLSPEPEGKFGVTIGCEGNGCDAHAFDLAVAFAAAAEGAVYISDFDREPVFVSADVENPEDAFDEQAIGGLLHDAILQYLADEAEGAGDWTSYRLVAEEADLLEELTSYAQIPTTRTEGRAWIRVHNLFVEHLTERRTLRAETGTHFEIRMVVGRTADGNLAGFLVGTVANVFA